jgi:ribosomal protein S18 acetylase RimI-like enzyme
VAVWDGWRGNMYRLAVLQEHRGRGIATRLVDEAHARLRGKGARRVTALVGRDELAAARLWEAAGYCEDQRVVRFVRNV